MSLKINLPRFVKTMKQQKRKRIRNIPLTEVIIEKKFNHMKMIL